MDNIVADTIMEQLSEKDKLIMAIQKLWSVKAYLYAVQVTTDEFELKYNYYRAGATVQEFIRRLENELFNVTELNRKYYESMTRNQKG